MDYDWITERVAVGGALDSRYDADELVAQGVTDIVNMCLGHSDADHFRHLPAVRLAGFGLADGENEGDLGYERLSGAVRHVAALLLQEPRAKVYLHCAAGISRSTAVMCGVLMVVDGLSLSQAVERVRRARPVANPHPAHLVNLLRWAEGYRERSSQQLS